MINSDSYTSSYNGKRYLLMDRVFIIGNGLDLSLNLKTNYSDFLCSYILDLIHKSTNSNSTRSHGRIVSNYYEDELFIVGFTEKMESDFVQSFLQDFDFIENLNLKKLSEYLKISKVFNIVPKGNFITSLYNQGTLNNWVDIEQTYFNALYVIKDKKEDVRKINSQLEFLKIELNNYLFRVSENVTVENGFILKDYIQAFERIVLSDPKFDRIKFLSKTYASPSSTNLFLNFNYTTHIKNILDNANFNGGDHIINIHGSIIDNTEEDSNERIKNELIFGYGDDNSKRFKELKERHSREHSKNNKTYKYFLSDKYDQLFKFINSNNLYEVIILGHSCGLSDRVLLKEIMSNENCISIRILHYPNTEDYSEKVFNLSRILDDPIKERTKIMHFNNKDKVPQLKDFMINGENMGKE